MLPEDDPRGRGMRMTMNVGQGFLGNAKQCQADLVAELRHVADDFDIYLQTGPLWRPLASEQSAGQRPLSLTSAG